MDEQKKTKKKKLKGFKIVRTHSAGVFAGRVVKKKGMEVSMKDAIRLHYWDGAASLSQMAMEGVTKPGECRFAVPVSVTLTQVIEILDVTKKAEDNIKAVPVWRV